MIVLLTGGTGFIGVPLAAHLRRRGHEVRVLSRRRTPGSDVSRFRWDPEAGRIDAAALENVEAVVHLAGKSIASWPWTETTKKALRESRVGSARFLIRALSERGARPRAFVGASGSGYYGNAGDEWLGEDAPPGEGFLAGLCREMEAAAAEAEALGARVVSMRSGLVLGRGGLLARMAPAFKLGLGAMVASGRHYMSWIHLDDAVRLYAHALEGDFPRGPVNTSAPHPVTNAEFSRTLARALGRPLFLRLPAPAISLSLGQMGRETLLFGQRLSAARARECGFQFRHDRLGPALESIFPRRRT